jgi:hypothetical protein
MGYYGLDEAHWNFYQHSAVSSHDLEISAFGRWRHDHYPLDSALGELFPVTFLPSCGLVAAVFFAEFFPLLEADSAGEVTV